MNSDQKSVENSDGLINLGIRDLFDVTVRRPSQPAKNVIQLYVMCIIEALEQDVIKHCTVER